MSCKEASIEWDVTSSEVQTGIPVGYEVELSPTSYFSPILCKFSTFGQTPARSGVFYYSLDNGVTWIDYPLGETGVSFSDSHKIKIDFPFSRSNYVFVEQDGTVYKVAGDGTSLIESHNVDEFTTNGFEVDVRDDSLWLSGQNKTAYLVESRDRFRDGNNSLNLQSEPIGIAVDGMRDTLWQVDSCQTFLKDLNGNVVKTFSTPCIDIEFSSSSSTSLSSSSSSSSLLFSSSSSSSPYSCNCDEFDCSFIQGLDSDICTKSRGFTLTFSREASPTCDLWMIVSVLGTAAGAHFVAVYGSEAKAIEWATTDLLVGNNFNLAISDSIAWNQIVVPGTAELKDPILDIVIGEVILDSAFDFSGNNGTVAKMTCIPNRTSSSSSTSSSNAYSSSTSLSSSSMSSESEGNVSSSSSSSSSEGYSSSSSSSSYYQDLLCNTQYAYANPDEPGDYFYDWAVTVRTTNSDNGVVWCRAYWLDEEGTPYNRIDFYQDSSRTQLVRSYTYPLTEVPGTITIPPDGSINGLYGSVYQMSAIMSGAANVDFKITCYLESSSSSSSSSSEVYCQFPECHGSFSERFSNWYFTGVKNIHTDNGKFYITVTYGETYLIQVDLYKNSARTNLMASGNSNASGTISINGFSNSISGTVEWDGVSFVTDNGILYCTASSSSTSSESISSSSSSSSNPVAQCDTLHLVWDDNSGHSRGDPSDFIVTIALFGCTNNNSNNCKLYGILKNVKQDALQNSITLYKDDLFVNAVAKNEWNGTAMANFAPLNNSGISVLSFATTADLPSNYLQTFTLTTTGGTP